MKKIIAMLLAGLMCLSFAACSSNEKDTPKESDNNPSNVTQTNPSDNDKLSGKVTVYMPLRDTIIPECDGSGAFSGMFICFL